MNQIKSLANNIIIIILLFFFTIEQYFYQHIIMNYALQYNKYNTLICLLTTR